MKTKSVVERLVCFFRGSLQKKQPEETPQAKPKEKTAFLPPKKEEIRKSRLNIGIDLGTSSTKVFMKELVSNKTYAYAFENFHDSFGPFCWPSTIRIANGCLHFGIRAESMEEGQAIRSFKICLACKDGTINEKKCSVKQCEVNHSMPGIFAFSTGDSEYIKFEPYELATLFIAALINEILTTLKRKREFDFILKYTFNLAVPLDMLNDPRLEPVFDHIIYLANQIKDDIYQEIPITKAKKLISEASGELDLNGLPSEQDRTTFLVPETHAAMMGYMVQGKAEPRAYAAIDVGAGTTDIAIFRRCSKDSERDFTYYHAATDLVGGDDIDKNILNYVRSQSEVDLRDLSTLLANIRHTKSNFSEKNGIVIAGCTIEPLQFDSAINPVLNKVLKHYRMTWGKGYSKERHPHRWKNMGILLLGGCTKLPFIKKKLSQYNPGEEFCQIIPDVRVVELPEKIKVVGSRTDFYLRDYANLLMVAHGASFHIGEIMSFFKPRDVDDVKPPHSPEDDGPFFGHWW